MMVPFVGTCQASGYLMTGRDIKLRTSTSSVLDYRSLPLYGQAKETFFDACHAYLQAKLDCYF